MFATPKPGGKPWIMRRYVGGLRLRMITPPRAVSGAPTPNGHQADYEDGLHVGTILLRADAVEWRDLPAAEIGNPSADDVWARFSRTNDWAVANGFAGFPNFHEADYGSGTVYETILIRPDRAEWRDVPAAEIGNPQIDDVAGRFAAINDYAVNNGFISGYTVLVAYTPILLISIGRRLDHSDGQPKGRRSPGRRNTLARGPRRDAYRAYLGGRRYARVEGAPDL
jgi:hypothetical protein